MGTLWTLLASKEHKIYLSELFSSKQIKTYQYIHVEEMWTFVSRLCTLSRKPIKLKDHLCLCTLLRKPIMLRDHLSRLTLSIISKIVLVPLKKKSWIVLAKKYFSESKHETLIVKLEEF